MRLLRLQRAWESGPSLIFCQLLRGSHVFRKYLIERAAPGTLAQFSMPLEIASELNVLPVYEVLESTCIRCCRRSNLEPGGREVHTIHRLTVDLRPLLSCLPSR